MHMSLSHSHTLPLSLKLSPEQKLSLKSHTLALRLELIQQIRDERYEPKAQCPRCSRSMTAIEIISGFNQDPSDFTTCCPQCRHRFESTLVCFGNGTRIELPFYCDCQTLDQLHGKETLEPQRLLREYPAIYRSAILHYGSIRQAFKTVEIEYEFQEISDWKEKVAPFLGRLPDTVIAGCVGVSVNIIRSLRSKLGISRYIQQKAFDEIEQE